MNITRKELFYLKAFYKESRLINNPNIIDLTKEYKNEIFKNDRVEINKIATIIFKSDNIINKILYEIRSFDLVFKIENDTYVIILPKCSILNASKIASLFESIIEIKKVKVELFQNENIYYFFKRIAKI